MARESTMNVSLTSTLLDFVRSKVESGGYESASEVIRESLRVLQQRDLGQQGFWSDVRRKVGVAKRQVEQRKTVDGEAAMRQIIAEAGGGQRVRKPRKKARRR